MSSKYVIGMIGKESWTSACDSFDDEIRAKDFLWTFLEYLMLEAKIDPDVSEKLKTFSKSRNFRGMMEMVARKVMSVAILL